MATFVKLLKNNGDKDHTKWPEWSFGDNWIFANKNKQLKPKAICIENPLISIIGITKYDGNQKPWVDLPGVGKDLNKSVNLWNGFFNYDVNILTDKQKNDKKITLEDAQKFFNDVRYSLVKNKHDSLICILGGHGHNDALITSDKQHYKLSALQDFFSCKAEPLFANKPKIFIVDVCRGGEIAPSVQAPEETWTRWRGVGEKDIHPDSDISIIYSNTKKYQVPENDDGSVMMPCLSNVMQSTNLCTHDLNNITTMLAEEVGKKTSLLCVELVSRNKYLIYFKKKQNKGNVIINGKNIDGNIGDDDNEEGVVNNIVYKMKDIRNKIESYWWIFKRLKYPLFIVICYCGYVALLTYINENKADSEKYHIPGFAEGLSSITSGVLALCIKTKNNIWNANKTKNIN
eukprot:13305_1